MQFKWEAQLVIVIGLSINHADCRISNTFVTYDIFSDGWLVGCFGLNGPLRQYFSLYRAVSQREEERKEK